MITSLFIKDFGIIEKASPAFGPGFNVLSGETGSGKSILVEALQMALGGRASSEYIRTGCERALVQVQVELGQGNTVQKLLSEKGVFAEDDGSIILTREINRSGRHTCRINGQPVPLNIYREAGQVMVSIQGQHEQQLLFVPERQLYLLDEYGGPEIRESLAGLQGLYQRWCDISSQIVELQSRITELRKRQDALNYQASEIDTAGLAQGEDARLSEERQRLVNAEKIIKMTGECYQDLFGGGSWPSAADLAGRSVSALDKLSQMDSAFNAIKDLVASSYYQIQEACRELAAYQEKFEFYPSRLEHVEERLDKISKLKRKYGDTIEEILSYRARLEKEAGEMITGEDRLEKLKTEAASIRDRLVAACGELTAKRRSAAAKLEMEIKKELGDLGMGGTDFKVVLSQREELSEKGGERVEFFISTNPGEPLKPLSRIISGGETSRILLAIEGALARVENIPTLVFDEVDAGIGGFTVRSVAVKLKKLSRERQIICVTHSVQVAGMADLHTAVVKTVEDGRTRVSVRLVNGEERLDELSRMLGSRECEGAARDHAREILELSEQQKER